VPADAFSRGAGGDVQDLHHAGEKAAPAQPDGGQETYQILGTSAERRDLNPGF